VSATANEIAEEDVMETGEIGRLGQLAFRIVGSVIAHKASLLSPAKAQSPAVRVLCVVFM
jgi:hypothetical protein